MGRWIAIGVTALAAVAVGWSYAHAGPAYTIPSACTFTAADGGVSQACSAKLAQTISVTDYPGVDPTGSTDSTTGINLAFAELRSRLWQEPVANYQYRQMTLVFPSGRYKVTSVNATGLKDLGWTIRGEGAVIFCTGANNVCFDLTASRAGKVEGLQVYGDNAAPPRVGIQIGRPSITGPADNFVFDNVSVLGTFTLASFYNVGSEGSLFHRLQLINFSSAASTFALVQDGANHWGITSAYQTITFPVDTENSFNSNTFIMLDARRGSSGGPAIWISRSAGHKFLNSYIATYATEAIDIYNTAFANQGLELEIHVETSTVTSCIKMLGTNLTPTLRQFRYADYAPQCTAQIVDLNAITTATFEASSLIIPQFGVTPGNGIFAPKTSAKFYGLLYAGAAANQTNLAAQGGWIQLDNRATASYGVGTLYISDSTNTDAAFKGTLKVFDAAGTAVGAGALGSTGTVTLSSGAVVTTGAGSRFVGDTDIDDSGLNTGSVSNSLRWGGLGTGEAIGSKRSAGGTNPFGLDFYTSGGTRRFSIYNGGGIEVVGSDAAGQITLSAGTGTATVRSGCRAVCTDTTANASVRCSVSTTTLTATGTGSDVINYLCF